MSSLYRHIDCLVQPSMQESFGLSSLEALAHGCPVIAANVDGLPEVVRHGTTGLCVQPELGLEALPELGSRLEGRADDMPLCVYDPATDALAPPRVVSPETLADAVERVLEDETYARFSASAIVDVRERFDFDVHVRAVMALIDRAAGHSAAPRPPPSL